MSRHAGMLAYGFAVAMARDRLVHVEFDVADDVRGRVLARGADDKQAALLNGGRAVMREGRQFSTVWADLEVGGERRRVWVNDVEHVTVLAKKGAE